MAIGCGCGSRTAACLGVLLRAGQSAPTYCASVGCAAAHAPVSPPVPTRLKRTSAGGRFRCGASSTIRGYPSSSGRAKQLLAAPKRVALTRAKPATHAQKRQKSTAFSDAPTTQRQRGQRGVSPRQEPSPKNADKITERTGVAASTCAATATRPL